jgi:hypothetical protein
MGCMFPEILALFVKSKIKNGIQFMVPQNCQSITTFNHIPDKCHRLPDLGTAVNIISGKYDFTLRMFISLCCLFITQLFEHPDQQPVMAMYVPYDIVHFRIRMVCYN